MSDSAVSDSAVSVAAIERSLVSGASGSLFEELVERWREAYDPPRVFWQTDQFYRVEHARRQLAQARERLRQALRQHERYEEEARQRAAALRSASEQRAAWRASPEGKAEEARLEARRIAVREEAHREDMVRRRYRIPAWAEWAAWRVSQKETNFAIAGELGVAGSVVGRAVMDYVYLNHPDVTADWHGSCPLDSWLRRAWLRRHFKVRGEPAAPRRVVVNDEVVPVAAPRTREDYRARDEWVYRQYLAGRAIRGIAGAVGLSRTRVDQICWRQGEIDRRRQSDWPKPKPWRASRNNGRPVDIDAATACGGPRDIWLTYRPPADPRLDNMEPVR